jgi:hypothetical protein
MMKWYVVDPKMIFAKIRSTPCSALKCESSVLPAKSAGAYENAENTMKGLCINMEGDMCISSGLLF